MPDAMTGSAPDLDMAALSPARQTLARHIAAFAAAGAEHAALSAKYARMRAAIAEADEAGRDLAELRATADADLADWVAGDRAGSRPEAPAELLTAERRVADAERERRAVEIALARLDRPLAEATEAIDRAGTARGLAALAVIDEESQRLGHELARRCAKVLQVEAVLLAMAGKLFERQRHDANSGIGGRRDALASACGVTASKINGLIGQIRRAAAIAPGRDTFVDAIFGDATARPPL